MATINPFDLLGDDEYNDPSEVIAAAELKKPEKPKKPVSIAPPQSQPAKLPSKPLPPAQAVRESRNEGGRGDGPRGGGRSGGSRGTGRGRGNFSRDSPISEVSPGGNNGYKAPEEGDRRNYADRPRGGGLGGFRGGRRGGFSNGEAEGERPRRVFERRSGTGRGNEVKRDGSGRGNWGAQTDVNVPENEEVIVEVEKEVAVEKPPVEDEVKESPAIEKEPEPEDKEMTLEEYEKVREEKRKALLSLKVEERKVDLDKEFKAMQPLSSKKSNDEIFIKLGSEKDKKKEGAEKDDKSKKSVSINDFLKTAEGDRYQLGGRGRGRGHGARGGFGGLSRDVAAPKIEDPGQFPSLSGK